MTCEQCGAYHAAHTIRDGGLHLCSRVTKRLEHNEIAPAPQEAALGIKEKTND